MATPFSSRQSSPRQRGRATSSSSVRTEGDDAPRPRTFSSKSESSSREHKLAVDTSVASAALSPYDSNSDGDEHRQRRRKRPPQSLRVGIGLIGRIDTVGSRDAEDGGDLDFGHEYPAGLKDDDASIESDDILTDDEDEADVIKTLKNEDEDDFEAIVGVASPRQSIVENARLKGMFAEKHPWRRQSRRDSTPLSIRMRRVKKSVNNTMLEDEDDEIYQKSRQGDVAAWPVLTQSRSEEAEEDDSSSATEDDASSAESSFSIISDPDEEVDFAALENIPSNFTSHPEVMLQYLDPSFDKLSIRDSNVFAYEHALLLRAVMQLLTERDYIGVEADLDDPSCVLKRGPIKKATHSVGRTTWRVKYAEVRPGSFSYFEDSSRSENLRRKTIQLRSSKCACQIVKRNQFAIEVEGGPRRLWMTNSEEERQAWVRAIQDAMIGAGGGDSYLPLDVAQYEVSLDQFQYTQRDLFQADSQDAYIASIQEILQTNIRVPIQWVSNQVMNEYVDEHDGKPGSSAQRNMNTSVTGFWKRLKQASFSINGHDIASNSQLAAERVVGTLSRCILEFDRSSPLDSAAQMSELQAISYSRDVIMAALRSRDEKKCYLAVEYLCQNQNLVCVERAVDSDSCGTINIQVNYATSEAGEPQRDISGWVGTRQRSGRMWRNRFVTISDGTLSVFEHSSPRPHGLKSQFLLAGATVSVVEDDPKSEAQLHILCLVSRDQQHERQLSFLDEALQQEWKEAIQKAIDSCSSSVDVDATPIASTRRPMPTPGGRIIKSASESSAKIINRATDQFVKATDILRTSIRSSVTSGGPHSRTSSVDTTMMLCADSFQNEKDDKSQILTHTASLIIDLDFKQEPTVQVMAESVEMFKIDACTPSEAGQENTWVTVRSKMLHTFLLSGGSSGRLTKGDELVEMEFRKGNVSDAEFRTSEVMLTPR